jgi:lysophospholipid acyltransferase (LPLAT)-like uncharacterized protein
MNPTLAALTTALAVRALGVTLAFTAAGLEPLRPLWAAGRPLIYAIWHGRILMAPWVSERLRRSDGARPVRVLASRSRDGELVTRFVRRFGLDAARGSSSRGGAPGFRALTRTLEGGADVVVVPDGPRGPSRRLQPGVVALAALTGAPVVPMGIAARPARRLGTWDEFLVPLPFARCSVVFGPAASIARGADREQARADLERALDDATAAADRMVSA